MEETREAQRKKFNLAMWAFEDACNQFDDRDAAFENEDVKTLFEIAFAAYLEWKNFVEEM